MSEQVHAPYHFVPLSKWVYLPDWAHLVSHDYPFKKGLSGSIELSLHNETPLLVGAESQKVDGSPALVKWVRTPEGKPVIPGSSLKGMLRSFLEVATFAKFQQIDNHRYAYRDISDSKTVYSTILRETIEQAAWLSFNAELKQWQYRPCLHTRLYAKELNVFLKSQSINASIENVSNQNALDKYKIWPLTKAAINFELGEYFTDRDKPRECAVQLGKGEKVGIPVFVGYRPGKGKDIDFNYLFYDVSSQAQDIDSELINQMFAAHDKDLVQYLKAQGQPTYGIPIFIRKEKNSKKITAIGLAKMPKMLYDNSVFDLAQEKQFYLKNQASFDFCELMFGTLRDHGVGLKSRVSFSDLLCEKLTPIEKSQAVILGQPQASYLNAYLEQPQRDGVVQGELAMYKRGSDLAGWKRYPSQPRFQDESLAEDLADKKNVQSQLELLGPGALFNGKIIFHNLTPIELGALLWALNPDSKFYHGLGHGKSLGAGAVQLEGNLKLSVRCEEIYQKQDLINCFIAHMNENYPSKINDHQGWENSPQIKHLLAFGDLKANHDRNLTYMPLQKKVASVTYSNSKTGTRKALPYWQLKGQPLNRREEVSISNDYVPRGRLSELVEKLVQDKRQLESMEAAEARYEQEQAELQMKMRKELASPLFKALLEHEAHLKKQYDQSGQNATNQIAAKRPDLMKILDQVIDEAPALKPGEPKEAYDIFNRYFSDNRAYSGLGKKKEKELQTKSKMQLEILLGLLKCDRS